MDSRVANTFWEVKQKNTPERVFFCIVDGGGFSRSVREVAATKHERVFFVAWDISILICLKVEISSAFLLQFFLF